MSIFASHPVGLPGLIALGIGFFLFFAALLSARARTTRDPVDKGGKRAPRSIVWIIVQGVGIGVAGFGAIAVSGRDAWSASAMVQGLVVLALMASAVALFDWSSRTMGRNWALVARTRSDASLVTSGPFAFVRNPIYIALFAFLIAMAIAYGHWGQLIIAVPLYWIGTWGRVQHEEAVLRAEFGAAYDAYAARVKRFVPGII